MFQLNNGNVDIVSLNQSVTRGEIMKVKELMWILTTLDKNAVIDISSDEEGNRYGDIDNGVAEGKLVSGEKVYSLYPMSSEDPEDRYLENYKDIKKDII